MRGVISLAAAFALPFVLPNGNPFPGLNYILFFTFCVMLVTLVCKGLTLAVLIQKLGIKDDGSTDEEDRKARVEANKAALSLVESLANNGDFSADTTSRLRAEYDDRLMQLELCAQSDENCGGGIATPQYPRPHQQALGVQRQTITPPRKQHLLNYAARTRDPR